MARGWYRSSGRRDFSSQWAPYVPVAERQRQAMKQIETLRKKGRVIVPIVIEGRKIATTFWGESWCKNLEAYSDYANRLPRGRNYVRNGSVVHLEIAEGKVEALVHGSSMYTVKIGIASLAKARWSAVVGDCSGRIDSLVELLQGRMSKGVMEVVTDKERGLFPSPKEIALSCSCPDWATMCKHVAAVMYGVGARLDTQPELLFRLRGVDPAALFAKGVVARATASARGRGRENVLAAEGLGSVFGIDIDDGEAASPAKNGNEPARAPARAMKAAARVTKAVAPKKKTAPKRAVKIAPPAPANERVSITVEELARAGVRVTDVHHWMDTGELTATRERGVYEASPAMRARLVAKRR